MTDSFVLLKKYSPDTVETLMKDLENDFSVFVLDRNTMSCKAVDKDIALSTLNSFFADGKRCYGYYNRPAPLQLTLKRRHDDLPKQLLVFGIQIDVMFQPNNKLADLLALNPEKETWSIGDFNKYLSVKLNNDLNMWIYERTADTGIHNLLELQDAAFLGDEGKREFARASFIPAYLNVECTAITVSREAELSKEEKIYAELEEKLRLEASSKGVASSNITEIINSTVSLDEARLILNKIAQMTELAEKYCVDIALVKRLFEESSSINEVEIKITSHTNCVTDAERFVQLAAWMAGETGISLPAAKEKIAAYSDRRRAEQFARDYVRNFKRILEFQEKFGIDTFDAAEYIVNSCGGISSANEVWDVAVKVKSSLADFQNMPLMEIAAHVKQKGVKHFLDLINKRTTGAAKRKSFGRTMCIVIVVVLALAGWWLKDNYREFTFQIAVGDPVSIENVVRSHSAKFSYDAVTRSYKFKTFISKKAAFIEELQQQGYVVKVSETDSALYVITKEFKEYEVRFFAKDRAEFAKVRAWFAANKEIKLIDASLKESGFGVKTGLFKIDSLAGSTDELKESLVAGIRTVCPNLDDKNIVVSNRK